MIRFSACIVLSFIMISEPALAQQAPVPPTANSSLSPSGAPTNPDLVVATVKLQGGLRMSKLIGSTVYNEQNEKVGSVDDLIMKDGNRIVIAILSVSSFLGIGNKLVAVPYDQLHLETNKDETKLTMPGASKEALNAMSTFTYGG